jgi:hypothetical protein
LGWSHLWLRIFQMLLRINHVILIILIATFEA